LPFDLLFKKKLFCRFGLSLVVDAAHLSDVFVAADSLYCLKPATQRLVLQHLQQQLNEAKS